MAKLTVYGFDAYGKMTREEIEWEPKSRWWHIKSTLRWHLWSRWRIAYQLRRHGIAKWR